MSTYQETCEALFHEWRSGAFKFEHDVTRSIFSERHAPEPYLSMGSSPRAIWLGTNPGEGFDYQLRPTERSDSIFAHIESYATAAQVLGSSYTAADAPINRQSRTRLAAAYRISGLVGCEGITQAEMVPWHSKALPSKARALEHLRRNEPAFRSYEQALSQWLENEPIIFAYAAGKPEAPSGFAIQWKAEAMSLDLTRAQMLPLTRAKSISSAMFYAREPDRTRALFVTQGADGLPSAARDEAIRAALTS